MSEHSYEDLFNQMYGNQAPEESKAEEDPAANEEPEQEEEQVEESDKDQEEREKPEQKAKEDPDQYSRLLDDISDPEVKKQVQHLVQSDRSQKGRVSALTKKLNKMEEMYQNALRTQGASKEEEPVHKREEAKASASTASDGREKEPELPPEVVAIKEKHPAVYQAFKTLANMENTEAVNKAKADIMKELDNRFAPVEERFEQDKLNQEAREFEKMASELLDTDNTNVSIKDVIRSEEFSKWIRGQSQKIQSFYKNASSADEGILVLTKFVNDTNYIKSLDERINPPKEEVSSSSKGDELREKRESRKRTSAGVKNTAAVTSGNDAGDYESIFNSFWGDGGSYVTRRNNG